MSFRGRARAWLRQIFRPAPELPPAAPFRFEEAVQLFRLQRPEAGPGEWQAFTLRLTAEAYTQGLARGVDRASGVTAREEERLHGWSAGAETVKALAGRDPVDPLRDVSPEERRQFLDDLAAAQRAGVDIRLEVAQPGPSRHDRRP